jgi:hypothetical protein
LGGDCRDPPPSRFSVGVCNSGTARVTSAGSGLARIRSGLVPLPAISSARAESGHPYDVYVSLALRKLCSVGQEVSGPQIVASELARAHSVASHLVSIGPLCLRLPCIAATVSSV